MRNPVLIGERVYLRGLEPSDAEPMAHLDRAYQAWRSSSPHPA